MRRRGAALLAILALASVLRFVGLDWDEGHGFHPDERRIVFALEEISFRPLRLNPHFFAYGSFPLYLQRAWVSAASAIRPEWGGYDGSFRSGRALSAVVGVASVAWLYRLGALLYGPTCGLVAALLLALAVLPIQHAHFITFDLYQAFLVLVALERLVVFTRTGLRRHLLAGSAAVGLALATKVSSAPLLLPLVIAALWVRPASGRAGAAWARALSLASGLATAFVCFAATEPYAFIDPQFLHDVREQAAMVREAGTVPYTIQYLGTRPYLDDLREAFLWGTGPVLGVAAALGTIAALFSAFRRPRAAEIVLLSFFVPYLAVTGIFPVKFMRYLLPLYALWCLYAAHLVVGERGTTRGRRTVLALVIAATAFHAASFFSIYLRPHVWITASRWFYRSVPAGAALITPHWEEGFPVGVDGHDGGQYRQLELPLYDGDGPQKTRLLAERLAAGDVLVFPSKRLYGAITNAPDRYPETNRFLQLLFAGDLGYRLDAVFASRPRLLGFELDDDRADESFSVYDHPKTLVFRKVAPLAAAEIATRIHTRVPSRRMTRADILASGGAQGEGAGGGGERPSGIESSLGALLLWLVALVLLAFAGRRSLAACLPRLPPAAIGGLGPTFGYLLFAYLSWIVAAVGLAPFSSLTVLTVALLLVALAARLPRPPGSSTAMVVFFASFFFFVAMRAATPEVYWGEKPMDFSFLNALYRTTVLPAPEPWMSGKTINYPHFGHFSVAALGKLTGVAPGLAFNLGIATIAGLTAAAAFGVGALVTESVSGGAAAALLLVFAGNLSGPVELARRATVDFNYFWATSRVIPDTINEFPLWSFLFADLHAHVLVLPLSLLLFGIAAAGAIDRRPRAAVPLLASLALGAVAVTNTWGFPIWAGALLGISVIAGLATRQPTRVVTAALAVAASFVWFAPFWHHFQFPPRNWGWETQEAPLTGVLLIFGLFLFPLLTALSDFLRRGGVRGPVRLLGGITIALVAAASVRALFWVLGATAIAAALVEDRPSRRVAFTAAGGAALLGGAADTIFLWDRMNTIFKLYLEMWLLFGIAGAVWLQVLRRESPARRWTRFAWGAAFSILVAASAVTAVSDVVGTLRTRHAPGPRPTLDGQAYLALQDPIDRRAIQWLNRQVSGTPVLLEAHGPSYQEFSRISMNTGLPTVLGWDYHLSQRAHSWDEINRRKADVLTIYDGMDRAEVEGLLDRYHVAMVYVGPLERRTYARAGLAKFTAWPDVFQRLYGSLGADVFAVTRNFQWNEVPPIVDQPAPEPERPAAESSAAVEAEPQLPLGQLRQPRALAVDARGAVWVADFGNDRIQRFDEQLRPAGGFGNTGEGPSQFNDPCGIAVGPDGRIYVADTWNHRVQIFAPNGELAEQWSAELYGPRGIAVAADGTVYVTDTGNGRVVVFSPEGEVAATWGTKGSGSGELQDPIGIATGGDRIYVADAGNRRIVVLDAHGETLAAWPVDGWKDQVYREPYLALLPDGTLAATDPPGDRVLFFDTKGAVTGERRLEEGSNPTGIAVGREGKLIVAALKLDRLVEVAR
ncbi:MAG: hypothetical protein QOD06_1082 [Candidatus Binatota bacterium]|nr:hypothetical protein [Candidatus Binatota bacterium]